VVVVARVMSQGPLTSGLVHVSTGTPERERTIRQPAGFSVGSAPPGPAGKLPTTTQPPGRTTRPVERPMPPGQDRGAGSEVRAAKVDRTPVGEIWTMVVPVPWLLALSLKLLTRVEPSTRLPTVVGTTTMP
jgi:hypothetical protein